MPLPQQVTIQNKEGKFLSKDGKWTAAENRAMPFASKSRAQDHAKTLNMRGLKYVPKAAAASKSKKMAKA